MENLNDVQVSDAVDGKEFDNLPNPSGSDIYHVRTQKFESVQSFNDLMSLVSEETTDGKIKITDKDGYNEIIESHTINVDFDFADVSIEEMKKQLVSTTTFLKMFQNNELKGLKDSEIVEMSKVTVLIKVRNLLDGRSRKTVDPLLAMKKAVKAQKATGKSSAEILAEMQKLLDSMDS
jgi:hypothetical protein